jgi:site-specific recombinase XerD
MIDFSQRKPMGSSPRAIVSGPLNDILAIPDRVNQLPDWLREPVCRFVRLNQRNWPANRVKQHTSRLCARMVSMILHLNEKGACQGWTDWSVRLIEDYIDDKLREGKAAATINLHLYQFRSFCKFAIDEGHPVPHILTRIKVLDQPKRLPRPLSDEQVQRLEACIQEAIAQAEREFHRKVAIRDLACFYLMWHCGMRTAEVQELCVRDVDLPGRKLFIAQSKEAKDRMIYISEATAAALAEHLANRRRPNSPYVFAGRNGPLNRRSISDRFRRYREQCDVPVTPHRLRHTFASQMLAAGMSIVSLQRYLGHENLNTTMIYAEVSDPLLQKDYYRGAATFDPASAELARQFLDLSQKDELRQLIAELKYPELEPQQRKKILEQMENLLDESEEASDMPGQSS